MKSLLRYTLALATVLVATQAAAEVTFYEDYGFQGRSFSTHQSIPNLDFNGLDNRASSVVVVGERWEVCQNTWFSGQCVVLRPGRYPSLATLGLNDRISSVRPVSSETHVDDSRYAPLPAAAQTAQVTFYENESFQGRNFTTSQQISDFRGYGFNDRATSVVVHGSGWEVCEDMGFRGRCVVLSEGRYPSLVAMGLNDRISSVRAVSSNSSTGSQPIPVIPQVTFYEDEDLRGRSFVTQQAVSNFQNYGFNNRARSAIVHADLWEVCDNAGYRGRCVVLGQGRYPSLASMGMNDRVSSVRTVANNASVVTFYEHEGFQGRSFVTQQPVENFQYWGYNDRASSVIVRKDLWEVCSEGGYRGRCVVLRQGRYPSLAAMGLNDRVSSVRPLPVNSHVSSDRYAPPPPVAYYDYSRRNNERLYVANVTSARAVAGTPERRCWVEQQQMGQQQGAQGALNVPGAIIGGVIGGILGHQIGGGSGKDIATVGGVVAGAAIGANVGRDRNGQPYPQNVQRCETTGSQTRPDYWDVTYNFRGREHRMQMSSPPGPTITVNEQGEPRT